MSASRARDGLTGLAPQRGIVGVSLGEEVAPRLPHLFLEVDLLWWNGRRFLTGLSFRDRECPFPPLVEFAVAFGSGDVFVVEVVDVLVGHGGQGSRSLARPVLLVPVGGGDRG
jgi:hypothetical protein